MNDDIRNLLQKPPGDVVGVVASAMSTAIRVGCQDFRDGADSHISESAAETAETLANHLANNLRTTPSETRRVAAALKSQLEEIICSQEGLYFYLPVALEQKIAETVRPNAEEFLRSVASKVDVKGTPKP